MRDAASQAVRSGAHIYRIDAMVLDATGQDVPETGLVFDEGDRDMLMCRCPAA